MGRQERGGRDVGAETKRELIGSKCLSTEGSDDWLSKGCGLPSRTMFLKHQIMVLCVKTCILSTDQQETTPPVAKINRII